jgi:chromosome segregation ATPase
MVWNSYKVFVLCFKPCCFLSAKDVASAIEPNVKTKKDTLKDLDSKVSERKDKLHQALTNCQASEQTLDDLLQWLRANDKAMKALKPMSENMDVLLQRRDFYEVCKVSKCKG